MFSGPGLSVGDGLAVAVAIGVTLGVGAGGLGVATEIRGVGTQPSVRASPWRARGAASHEGMPPNASALDRDDMRLDLAVHGASPEPARDGLRRGIGRLRAPRRV